MKSPIRYSALAVMRAAALVITTQAAVSAAATSASTPAPTAEKAPATERTYPSVLPLTLEVSSGQAYELKSLRDLTITAQREGDYAPMVVLAPVDPFTDDNTCMRPMPDGITGCLVNGTATVGTIRVNWQVPQAGIYRFVLSGKRGASDRVETLGAFDLEARD